MRILRGLPLLLALCLAVPGACAISAFEADYDLAKGVVKLGEMNLRLSIDDDRYHFESRMESTGLVSLFSDARVVEQSTGRIEAQRFVPERYRIDKKGSKRDYVLDFDYAANTVRRGDDDAWSAQMPAGILDKLSYQAQLMFDLDAAPARIDYVIADKNKLKQYLITNLGSETVDTALGRFDTVKLERNDPDSPRRTRVWYAAELGWIPVRVEHRDKRGSVIDATIRTLNTAR